MHRFAIVSLLLILSVALGGCVRFPGGIAPSTIPLGPDDYVVLGRVGASDCKVNLFGLLPVSGGNHIQDALDDALRERPDAIALVQVTVDRVSKYFILWSQTCTEVRGLAVARRRGA